MRFVVIAGTIALSAIFTTTARAEEAPEPPRFGRAGQLVISDDQTLGAASSGSFQFAGNFDNANSTTSFSVSPAVDYFVLRNLSVGANVMFGVANFHQASGPSSTATSFGVAPRVGYNLPISQTFSFWPKLSFAYTSTSLSNDGPSTSSTAIGLYAPLMIHPVPHFFLGVGPDVSTQLSSNLRPGADAVSASQPKITQVGVQVTLGGWLLGD